MAKDGTNRGGARPGAGRKKKSLTEKVTEGRGAQVLTLPKPANLKGTDVPPIQEYMKAKQKDGSDLGAIEIYEAMWQWIIACGCEKLIEPHIVEEFSVSFARWRQCQRAINDFGFLAKHPTTGAAIASPYVSMAGEFKKQSDNARYQINQIIKENCSGDFAGSSFDPMEQLLKSKGG